MDFGNLGRLLLLSRRACDPMAEGSTASRAAHYGSRRFAAIIGAPAVRIANDAMNLQYPTIADCVGNTPLV
ncbi:MAG: hypothetical protein ACRERY_11315, partial [Pseudomonas sp.]